MKFGKRLAICTQGEWRTYYVSYKRLKRITERLGDSINLHKEGIESLTVKQEKSNVTIVRDEETGNERIQRVRLIDSGFVSGSGESKSPEYDELLNEFFEIIEKDLKVVNDFYLAQEVLLETRINDLNKKTGEPDLKNFAEINQLIAKLTEYVDLNFEGFRKIVKKLDKVTKDSHSGSFVTRLKSQPFYSNNKLKLLQDTLELNAKCSRETLLTLSAEHEEKSKIAKHGDFIGYWKTKRPFSLRLLALAITCALIIAFVPIESFFQGNYRAQRTLGLLTGITILWVTEGLPYFVTSISIPVLVVAFDLIDPGTFSDNHSTFPITQPPTPNAVSSSHYVLTHMFDHVTFLILGGFSISAAFSSCELEIHIAAFLQRRLGKSPRLFMLSIMFLALFLSMWISNVTAPVLVLSVILPIIRDFPSDSRYTRALLVGLAFSCNLGGMLTPISSPQNAVAIGALESAGYNITFFNWVLIAFPFASFCLVFVWMFLIFSIKPDDIVKIPALIPKSRKLKFKQWLVISLTVVAIVLWSTLSIPLIEDCFGDLGIIALTFMVVAFGSGILSKVDLKNFSWDLLLLIGGGNILGVALKNSGLLTLFVKAIQPALGGNEYVVTLELVVVTLVMTTFVSHTVSALILMNVVVSIGTNIGHPELVLFVCALASSASCCMPMSSFPNMLTLLAEDDFGHHFLKPEDYLRNGIPVTILTGVGIMSIAYYMSMGVLPSTYQTPT